MKKINYYVAAIASLALVILVIMMVQPLRLEESAIVSQNEAVNQVIKEMGLDEKSLLNEQKITIINDNLAYLSSFSPQLYTMPSVNPYVYSREWGNYTQYDYDTQPSIETMAYLFIDQQKNYHVMINYIFTKIESGYNYLELQFSNHYKLTLLDQKSYLIYHNNEYLDNNVSPLFDYSKNQFEMPISSFKQSFKRPMTKGFYHFKLVVNVGYESSIFSCLINIFEQTLSKNETVTLGFNGFRSQPNKLQFIPRSLSVFYQKEGI